MLTTPRDLPAPGRRQTLYVVLRLQQSPVFLINSRLDLFTVTGRGSKSVSYHPNRHPFSRSYGAILPSSLTIVLPIALVCSTHLPVSVLVRAPTDFLEVFLGSMGSLTSLNCFVQHLSHMRSAFHYFSAYVSSRGRPEPRLATLLRHPIGDNALLEGQEFLPVVHRLRLPALP